MAPDVIEDKTFTKIGIEALTAHKGVYENCKFVNCDFSYAHLSGIVFRESYFDGCNLSLVKFAGTGLQDIRFKDCKLSGADFSKSLDFLFEVAFENCLLDNAIFYRKKCKGTKLEDCSMVETDLTEADFTDAKFLNCNLNRAFFNRTTLKNADLRMSYNFVIDPNVNILKKAKFSIHGLPGLLAKYDIKIEG